MNTEVTSVSTQREKKRDTTPAIQVITPEEIHRSEVTILRSILTLHAIQALRNYYIKFTWRFSEL